MAAATNLTGAIVVGANFGATSLSTSQLYSTASYQAQNLQGIGLSQVNLTQWNLAGQNLTNANLSSATLTNTNLTGANLAGANFSSGTLSSADLTGAAVVGANFAATDLSASQLESTASYQAQNLQGIGLSQVNLLGENFAGQSLTNANLSFATLTHANLANANLTGGTVAGAVFDFSNLTASQLYSTFSYQTRNLQGIGLYGNNLTGWNLSAQNLTNSDLRYANLTSANLSSGTLTNVNLTGATVVGANFGATSLTASQLYSTASYRAQNLQGIGLSQVNLTQWNFSGQNLTNADLSSGTLAYANLTNANLTNANLFSATLAGANLTNANLTNANLSSATLTYAYLTNANLTGASVAGANFGRTSLTASQLYSTASYNAQDLQGISLDYYDLTGWSFSGQNLTSASFYEATLTNATLTNATLTDANFERANLSCAKLTNANLTGAFFAYADLTGTMLTNANLTSAVLGSANLTNAVLSNANLTSAELFYANLTNAMLTNANLTSAIFYDSNLTGADLRGARGLNLTYGGNTTTNTIFSDGTIQGLSLSSTAPTLIARNYAGNIPIHVQQGMTMNPGTSLVLQFDGNPWGSTISFDAGIPVTLGGNLEFSVAGGVNPATLIGQTFQVFNWSGVTGVTASGQFSFVNDVPATCLFDVSQVYSTGNVSVLGHAVPSLSVTAGNNQTVIVGATGIGAGLSLSNGTLGQNELASLDVNSLGNLVFGSTGYALVASGSAQCYTAVLNTCTLGTQTQTFTLNAGDDHTLVGASPATDLTTTATLTVLGHAAPTLAAGNQTVIVGATGIAAGLTLSNGTAGQSGLAALDVNSLGSGVIGPTGGALVPSGSSQSYTAPLNTSILGVQAETFSLNVGDDHTLAGASPQFDLSTTATLTVLGHAAPSLAVTSGSQTVIVGAAGVTAGFLLSNGTANQCGLAALDVNSVGPGVNGPTGGALVASGSSQPYTATLTTGTLGPQTETFSMNVGDDHTLPGASAPANVSATAALTVMDHSNASLSSTATQTSQTINFGNVLKGATIPGQSLTIYNLAANTTAAYTANLKLTGSTETGEPALTTTLSPFNGLAAGSGNTYTASLNTGNYTTSGIKTVTMSASKLADDSTLPGAGNNNNGGLTITLQGNVGNATADASNSQTSFGPALTAPVAQNASYANLESTVTATSGSGGQGMVGSTATILAGTASVPTTVSMAWRTATSNPQTGVPEGLASDVLDLTGIGTVDGQIMDGRIHTDTFVLQLTYNPLAVMAGTGLSELDAAEAGLIQMDYLDEADDQWVPAVLGNFGGTPDYVGDQPYNSSYFVLGDYGVDVQTHTVWAVLDHNSQFAVVPEPGILALLAAGAICLAGFGSRRRKREQ